MQHAPHLYHADGRPRHVADILAQIAGMERRRNSRTMSLHWTAAAGAYRAYHWSDSLVRDQMEALAPEELPGLVEQIATDLAKNTPATIESAMFACIRLLAARQQQEQQRYYDAWIAACALSLRVLAWRDRLLAIYEPEAISPEKWAMTSRVYRLAERREDAARQAYYLTLR